MNSALTEKLKQLRAALVVREDKDRGESGSIEHACTVISKELRSIERDLATDKYLQKGGGYVEEGLAIRTALEAVKAAHSKLWDAAGNYSELMKP